MGYVCLIIIYIGCQTNYWLVLSFYYLLAENYFSFYFKNFNAIFTRSNYKKNKTSSIKVYFLFSVEKAATKSATESPKSTTKESGKSKGSSVITTPKVGTGSDFRFIFFVNCCKIIQFTFHNYQLLHASWPFNLFSTKSFV